MPLVIWSKLLVQYVAHLYSTFNFDFFFFQAEDGIRDGHVTGVQTCALPISLTEPENWHSWAPPMKSLAWTPPSGLTRGPVLHREVSHTPKPPRTIRPSKKIIVGDCTLLRPPGW